MTTYPSTARFSVYRHPNREPDSRILNIRCGTREFGHTWDIRGWAPEDEGKWTFNRSELAIEEGYWPGSYLHDSLAALLDHLEGTFPIPRDTPPGDYP